MGALSIAALSQSTARLSSAPRSLDPFCCRRVASTNRFRPANAFNAHHQTVVRHQGPAPRRPPPDTQRRQNNGAQASATARRLRIPYTWSVWFVFPSQSEPRRELSTCPRHPGRQPVRYGVPVHRPVERYIRHAPAPKPAQPARLLPGPHSAIEMEQSEGQSPRAIRSVVDPEHRSLSASPPTAPAALPWASTLPRTSWLWRRRSGLAVRHRRGRYWRRAFDSVGRRGKMRRGPA